MSDIRTCQTCGAWQSYPRPVCTICHGRAFMNSPLPQPAKLYSLTTIQRAPSPQFADAVPYTIGLVRGPSGGLLMVQLHNFPTTPEIGDQVSIEASDNGMIARPAR